MRGIYLNTLQYSRWMTLGIRGDEGGGGGFEFHVRWRTGGRRRRWNDIPPVFYWPCWMLSLIKNWFLVLSTCVWLPYRIRFCYGFSANETVLDHVQHLTASALVVGLNCPIKRLNDNLIASQKWMQVPELRELFWLQWRSLVTSMLVRRGAYLLLSCHSGSPAAGNSPPWAY